MRARHNDSVINEMIRGAAGGVIGTLAIYLADYASQKMAPSTMEPMKLDPGEYMVHQAQHRLPAAAWNAVGHRTEKTAAYGLSLAYGATFGALYAALKPRGGSPWLDGSLLGIVCWAVGYLGWLPQAGVLPPMREQKAAEIAGPVARHAVYGMATVCAYDWITEQAG